MHDIYSKYVNCTDISAHIYKMVEPGTWATLLKVIGVAIHTSTCHWEVAHPLNDT